MGLVNFGSFQIDLEERRIYSSAGELPVEPKVVDVLCYLIQNSDRFVSLQELHAEVWTGRVVTDTAVRRTISKLRAVLGDTDQDAPLFIKSQMKRGYQFIGLPVPAETSEASPISPVVADGRLDLTTSETSPAARPKPVRFWYGLLSVALLALVFWSLQFTQQAHEKPVMTTEPLVSIAGEKHFLSVSENGRYQAFTGRLDKNEGWQPYLYDRQLGHLQKIALPMNSDFPIVAFVNDDTVVVSIVEGGESKLYLYLIANLNTAIKTIKLESLSRIGQVVPYHGNAVLINGQKNGTNNFFYYILNLDDETLKQFTFSSQSNSTDFNAAFSPDKQYFSFIRRDTNYQVQVLRADDKTLLAEELFDRRMVPADEVNLLWLTNQLLLINGGDKFKLLDVANGSKLDLPISERFSGLGRDKSGNLFGLLKQAQKSIFYQAQLTNLSSILSYFTFNGQVVSLNYSQTPNQLWLVEKDTSGYQLQLYHAGTGEKKSYFKSNELFSVIEDEQNAANLLLLFNNKQLKLLDHRSGKLTDISDINQKIDFSTFAADKKVIFFSEKIGNQWQVNVFDRQLLVQRPLLKGYRLILPWNQQFIAADATGQFYLLDQQYQNVKQLQLKIDFKFMHQVSLRDNKLIAANIGVDSHWRLAILDLISGRYRQQVINNLPIKTKFSFNNEGNSAIVIIDNIHENQLVNIGYNLGYN